MLILLSVCLMASPSTCREERVNWTFEDANFMGCLVHAQGVLAQWQTEHPDWRVQRWRCVARTDVPTDL
ncbi:MAG TPA: hypothetical protein VHN20_16850 [Beijerinckiaceae bacterium]|nr:hypothetical protein [Beijerinckiaceae bacterium]